MSIFEVPEIRRAFDRWQQTVSASCVKGDVALHNEWVRLVKLEQIRRGQRSVVGS